MAYVEPGAGRRRSDMPIKFLVGSLVLGIVVATFTVVIVDSAPGRAGGSSSSPLGLSFNQASAMVSATLANVSGGPWRLVTVTGVVSTQPVVIPVDTIPVGACQDMAGPTVWNGSKLPAWSGALDSGIVPFWEFLYVNSSGTVLPAQTVGQSLTQESPVPLSSPCGRALAALGGPGRSLKEAPTVSAPIDSTDAAQIAWDNGGSEFIANNHEATIFFGLGGPQPVYGILQGPGWGMYYSTCGMVGISGNANETDFGIPNATVAPVVLTGNSTCTERNNSISFGSATSSTAPGGGLFSSLPMTVQAFSLSSWMITMNLTNSTGQAVPLASVSCSASSLGPGSCSPSRLGWIAALTTDRGYWLDVFGQRNGTPSWVLPNVGVYSNDSLVVYLPQPFESDSLTLSLGATESTFDLSGSAVL
jgi:hypothetical protein